MTGLIGSAGGVAACVGMVLGVLGAMGVVRARRPRSPQRSGGCGVLAPGVEGTPRQPDLYVWPHLSPERARRRRWWRCSERRRAESGRGSPFLASEPCWGRPVLPARDEQPQDADTMVRLYVSVHVACGERWT